MIYFIALLTGAAVVALALGIAWVTTDRRKP